MHSHHRTTALCLTGLVVLTLLLSGSGATATPTGTVVPTKAPTGTV